MPSLATAVDTALEITVVPSFTRIGPEVRSRLDHWAPLPRGLDSRTIVITGATSGLGLATARLVVPTGATVVLVARNATKAAATRDQLLALGGSGEVHVVTADMSDLDSVRAAAAELRRRHPRIDALAHNAGALDATHGTSPQGFETTVAGQVLGPFLLTSLLVDQLAAAPHARVVWMASGGMYTQPLSVDDLEMTPDDYDGTTAYARAKRAQVTLSELLAAHPALAGTSVHAMHPGWADTPGVRASLPTFRRVMGPLLRSPEQGADTLAWLCTDDGAPVATTGRFWLDRRERSTHKLPSTRRADTPAERQRLWAWCVERTGAFG
jgi:dehydrogenase/reductase SDR family protein 12